MRGRHIRRKLAWPWPEWVAWVAVAAIWAVSSATVWLVMTSAYLDASVREDQGRITVGWEWPWDR